MTAINVLLQREAGHIFTDGAWYDITGTLFSIGQKSQVIGRWPGAIATRGTAVATAAIAFEAGGAFPDFDAFVREAAPFLRTWVLRHVDFLASWGDQGHVELCAVGWSISHDAPRGIIVTSRDEAALARERGVEIRPGTIVADLFEVVEIDMGFIKPMPDPEALTANGVRTDLDLDEIPDVADFGTRIVCSQREMREPLKAGAEPLCFVGGCVMHTRITRESVTMSQVAAFPDHIGERMDARRGDVIRLRRLAGVVPFPNSRA